MPDQYGIAARSLTPSDLPEHHLLVELQNQYTIQSIATGGTVNQTPLGASSYGELDGDL
jgi:hypothetical protein